MAENTDRLTHIDEHGAARMVDVAGKPVTHRRAVAEGIVRMLPATLALIESGEAAKGDVIAAARIAGIMAAKRTSELVPLCHPLSLTHVSVEIAAVPPATGADATDTAAGSSGAPTAAVRIRATAETDGKTGVEMEALTAASVAALTIYDMCKAVDRGMVIDGVKLLRKEGGASGTWTREED